MIQRRRQRSIGFIQRQQSAALLHAFDASLLPTMAVLHPPALPPKDFRSYLGKIQSYFTSGLTLRGSRSCPQFVGPVYHRRVDRGGGEYASLKPLQILTVDLARSASR